VHTNKSVQIIFNTLFPPRVLNSLSIF